MTSQAVEGMWICSGGYGQLRGELVERKDALQAVNQKHINFVEWMIEYFIVFICYIIISANLVQILILLCSGEKCVDFCVKSVPFIFLDSILVTSLFLFCLCTCYKLLHYA